MQGCQDHEAAFAALDSEFCRLWQGERERLYGISFALTRRNSDDAKELLNDATLRLLVSFRKRHGDVRNFSAWAAQTIRNLWIENHRSRSRAATAVTRLTECQFAAVGLAPKPQPPVLSRRIRSEDSASLHAHVDAIPEIHRSAFVMRCIEGRPYDQLAATLGITEAAARKRVELARKFLKRRLAEDPQNDRSHT